MVATFDELSGSLDKINGQNMDFADKLYILILIFFQLYIYMLLYDCITNEYYFWGFYVTVYSK